MDILPLRDLIKDDLGNIYVVIKKSEGKLILVNAAVYYSFKRILDVNFVNEVNNNYNHPVAVGQYFTDMVRDRMNGLMEGKYPGKVYLLDAVKKQYDVVVDGIYERSVII